VPLDSSSTLATSITSLGLTELLPTTAGPAPAGPRGANRAWPSSRRKIMSWPRIC
jgi:hypothetical protein